MLLGKALAATLFVGAALHTGAANAALITHDASTAGGSDLVLFVTSADHTKFYAQDLNVQVDSLRSRSTISGDPVYNPFDSTNGPMNNPAISGTSSQLKSFLDSNPGSTWTIMGADITGPGIGKGDRRLVVTSKLDLPGVGITDSMLQDAAGNAASFFATDINLATFTNGQSTTSGCGDATGGKACFDTFISGSYANGAAIGEAQTLYMVATYDNSSPSTASNSYVAAAQISVLANGTIQVGNGAPVPLPAAVWLFGSGLIGLVGVGRRRKAGQALAA